MAEKLTNWFKNQFDRNANTVERDENGNGNGTLQQLHRRDHDNCSPTLDIEEVNGEKSQALVPFDGQAMNPTDENAQACHVFQHRNIVALNQFQVCQNENNSTEAAAKTKVQGDANQTFSNLNAEHININFGKEVQEAGDIKQYASKAVQTTAKDFGRGLPNAKFNDLCFKVIEYIDGQDNSVLRKLKVLCMVESDDPDDFGIPMEKFEDLKNGIQFVVCLRKCQLFSPENILYLQYLLHKIEADPLLVDEVTTYGESCKHNPLRMFTQKESSAQGVVSIKFHLKGQLSKFTQMRADEFRDVLSEKLGIPNYVITINGIDEGSIIITLQMPKRWNGVDVVDRLQQQIHAPENWIQTNNILDIDILDKSHEPTSGDNQLMISNTKSTNNPVPKQIQRNVQQLSNILPPLPPPSAKENIEMAEKAIHNIMKEHPEAEMTEIVIQTTHFVAKYCDENGGYLEVGSKAATLLVPPYALEKKNLIYLQIETSQCFMGRHEDHQITPVVQCGTPGTKFSIPVILTLLTSVENADYLDVTGLKKGDVGNRQDNWQETSENGGKIISTGNGKCVMMLNHVTVDAAVAKPKELRHFAEICFAAFTSPVMGDDMIFDIRIWMSSNQEWLKQVISITKLQFDHQVAGVRESRVFRIRPHGEFRPKEAVDFDIAMFQYGIARHEVKIQVHVIPEVIEPNVRPGQDQPYHVSRQALGWKPTKDKFEQLKQSLSTDDSKWLLLAAWFHLNIPDFDNLTCPISAMISHLCSKHDGATDNMRRAIEDLDEPLQNLGSKYQEASNIVKDMLTSGTFPRPEGTDVVLRQPVQETWTSFNPHEPINNIWVTEYRYNPYQYHTLSSVIDQYRDGTLEARQVTQQPYVEQEQDQGERPNTFVPNSLVPRGVVRIDPNRSSFAAGITNAAMVNLLGNDDYDVVVHPSDMASTQQDSVNQIQPSVEVVDVQAIARGDHPEPQYMKMLPDHRKPNMKGYVTISKEVN